MAEALQLPVIDLSSPDRLSSANSIRQACIEYGFFYLSNHGVKAELLREVLSESRKFFSLPVEEKMKLARKEHRGYSPLYDENLDPASSSKGDSKQSYYVGPLDDPMDQIKLNQWPPEDILPSWRPTMESYYRELESAGKRLLSLVALSLSLDEDFFVRVGGLDKPTAFLRLLHYPGDAIASGEEIYGASAHSDYGMITLLATDGVPGLQICRDKSKRPFIWEDVPHIEGTFIVNIGDMMERWTNCLFRSTLHRVMPTGQERYSVAFFLDPDRDCIVECLPSCCGESCPSKFSPIRSGDYLKERLRVTYGFAT
ncbi:2-oxoglutarate-Fe(II) type oxidoreductase hxnY-like [Punica granatum]|uniref:2-oxoglutarate-Fe(II) type oxidoreductase hxnY-like n=2 Tax=Punica granatum TaxID=22663 RepID=A0A6P8DLE1_PUNGR|nr:2-oxoglutarate-Fe(II) type oxidoreductase hxnY-like [Punica granatum]XP_031392484.1 2-oxoglutarate-Fe(II) type oxidoreductase hxnY-like [Punica granatum]PKI41541.1 hypothetical protein CRG98_038052 [Punica granatum]